MRAIPSLPVRAAELTRAFEDGDLLLHYQPQVDVSHTWPLVVGYEALTRWPSPDGSFIPPDLFIPVAEESGLIQSLDAWVIEAVCTELVRIKSTGGSRDLTISANVAARQFRKQCFANSVADILTRTSVNPACLTLEITERAVLDETEATLSNLHALREMGVSLALDDFGTGYSSLAHLKNLPIQEIKLDRSFVLDLPHRHRDAAIVRATIDLAAALDLRVVAEGVELACQSEWLRMNGCQVIQGFLYGRPAHRRHGALIS